MSETQTQSIETPSTDSSPVEPTNLQAEEQTPQPAPNGKWLFPTQAANQTRLAVSEIEACVNAQYPIKACQQKGLLFDARRKEQGLPYLQVLETKPEARSYAWGETPRKLVIQWLPPEDGEEQQVLLVATTYDDFPVARTVKASEIKNLPKPIVELMRQLYDSLTVRKVQYRAIAAKQQPRRKLTPTVTTQSSANNSKRRKVEDEQAKLF